MMKPAIAIIGAAPGALSDLAALPRLASFVLMAIGLDAVALVQAPLKYVATYHSADIPEIYRRRETIGGNTDFELISHKRDNERISIVIDDWWKPSGSSALLGVQAALRIGYDRIIVCGCPLEGKNAKNSSYEGYRRGWEAHAAEISGKVRSMSGWTRDFLGAPTNEWLLESPSPLPLSVPLSPSPLTGEGRVRVETPQEAAR